MFQEVQQENQDIKDEQTEKQEQEQDNNILKELLDTLKEVKQQQQSSKDEALDALLKELIESPQEEKKVAEDLEEIANDPKKLVEYVLNKVNQSYIQPLLIKMEQMRVQEEIRECRQKYDDFDDHKEEILKIALQHPSLTLEQAYLLAKAKSPQKSTKSEPKEQKEQKVVSIEDLKKAHSLKQSQSRQAMREMPNDIRSAAAKAIAEILGEAVT